MLEKIKVPEFFYKLISTYYFKKPEMAELMQARYANLRAIVNSGLNEVAYRFKLKKVPRLVSLTIEPTNICNFRCVMCPVNRGMKRKKGLINFELYKKLIDENPTLEFVLLFHWGEPLLYPRIFDMIEYAGQKGIKPILTTNSSRFTKEVLQKIVHSKLDRITVSMDGIGKTYEKIRGYPFAKVEKNVLDLVRARNKAKSRVKIDLTMVISEKSEENVEAFIAKWKKIVDRLQIQPAMELVQKKPALRNKKDRCRELWRGNLIVHWDGTVVPCCVDFEGLMKLGDANKEKLTDILNAEPMQKLRQQHNTGNFKLMCKFCQEYVTSKVKPRFRWNTYP